MLCARRRPGVVIVVVAMAVVAAPATAVTIVPTADDAARTGAVESTAPAAATGAASVATADESVDTAVPSERPTENVTERLVVSVDPDTTTATLRVIVFYPARTDVEAAKAANGTLDPGWFQGQERIQRIFDAASDHGDSLANGSTSVTHAETLSGRTPSEPEYGWVRISYETAWYGYLEGETDLRIDDAYLAQLDDGWELHVAIPTEWEPSTVAGDPVQEPTGQQLTRYRWTITSDLPSPLLVVEDPVTTQESEDSPLGSAGGLVPALVALLAVLAVTRALSARR